MKRIFLVMLAVAVLFSCAAAEEEKSAEDLGREIFSSLTQEYDYSLNYLKHRQSVWTSFVERTDYNFANESDAEGFWLSYVCKPTDGSMMAIGMFYMHYIDWNLDLSHGDYRHEIYEKMFVPLYDHFGRYEDGYKTACMTFLKMVFYGDTEVHYRNLEGIKEKIRDLGRKYPDYEYNAAFKEFYRKCLQMKDYIADSSDSLIQAKEEISNLEKTKRQLRSEFDFDFEWRDVGMDSWYGITDTMAAFYRRVKRITQSEGFSELGGIFASGRAAVRKEDGKWGFVDTAGDLVIDCKYSKVSTFRHGYAIVTLETGEKGVIDPDGNEIIPIGKYADVGSYEDGLFRIWKDGKFGYVNEKDEIVIRPVFEDASYFSEGCASVRIDGKWGAIDKTGEIVISPRFGSSFAFSEGRAVITEGERYYYIDPDGEKLFGTDYARANKFCEGVATCLDAMEKDADGNFPFRVIRTDGETVYTLKSQNFGSYQEGLVWYLKGGLIGFLDEKGQPAITPAYSSLHMAGNGFTDGFVAAQKDGKWGLIDRNNNVVIPFEYDKVCAYSEGFCIAIKGNRIYIFDKNGKNVYEQ